MTEEESETEKGRKAWVCVGKVWGGVSRRTCAERWDEECKTE